MKRKQTRKELESEVKMLRSKVRRLQRDKRELKAQIDEQFGPDSRRLPYSEGEFA